MTDRPELPLLDSPSKPSAGRGESRRPVLTALVHSLRVATALAVAGMIHVAHARRSTVITADSAAEQIAEIYGATSGSSIAESDGSLTIVDEHGQVAMTAVLTSPAGDEAIGFSGPTTLIVKFDPKARVDAVRIVRSADTPAHVAVVKNDPDFLSSYHGLTQAAAAAHQPDAVSGATLTSFAVREAITLRLGGDIPSRFGPVPKELARRLYPDAKSFRLETPAGERTADQPVPTATTLIALGPDNTPLGRIDRTAPTSERVAGFQGPTDVLLAVDNDGLVTGLTLGESLDNEPYVSDIRDDWKFPRMLNGRRLNELTAENIAPTDYEGVSGASRTSVAAVDSLRVWLDARQADVAAESRSPLSFVASASWRERLALALALAGLVLTFLSGRRLARYVWPVVVLVGLGVVAGDLVSLAMLAGWSRTATVSTAGVGLLTLTAIALFAPPLTGRNVYCSHLCPHGAAQQLLRKLPIRETKFGPWTQRMLRRLPACLLAVLTLAAASGSTDLLVSAEPFDAYLWPICGLATVVVFVVGLVASAVSPMAYCRFGCPTGSLLQHLRRHRRSGAVTFADVISFGLLLLTAGIAWLS